MPMSFPRALICARNLGLSSIVTTYKTYAEYMFWQIPTTIYCFLAIPPHGNRVVVCKS